MSERLAAARRALAPFAPLALPGLAGALALLLALEWLLPGPATGPARPPALPAATGAGAVTDSTAWAATVLARPLFSQSRRPDESGVSADGTLPRLSAIIVTANGATAVFSPAGQAPQLVGVGSQIDGYQVQSIRPDAVGLLGPAGMVKLHPQFATATADPAAPSTPAAAPPPAPPAMPASNFHPVPPATPTSNPALYLEQNF